MQNNNAMTRRTFVGTAAALSSLAVLPAANAATTASTAQNSVPQTIPALREWTPAAGSFNLGPVSQIVVRCSQAATLAGIARTFAADLTAMGQRNHVEISDRPARAGDIILEVGASDPAIGTEGYLLAVGDFVAITARTAAGAFYGTRTILQLLNQSPSISAGTARDWPRYAERGLMVDIARMNFTYDWLATRIRDMAYLKLNLLHLHFTDNEGWRIESRLGVQSSPCLTRQQVCDLVALAAKYQVTVVPEIDMPSHMAALLKLYPQFQLVDSNGTAAPDKLDYSIPAARDLLREVIAEYIPLFPGPYWHMGTDEFLAASEYANYPQLVTYAQQTQGPSATGKDGLIGLVNEMNTFVRRQGKTLRIWNDLLSPDDTVSIDKDVVLEWWTDLYTPYPQPINPDQPQALLTQGYSLLNSSFFPTYDYPAGPPVLPSVQWMYEKWTVATFHGFAYTDDQGDGFPFYTVNDSAPGNRGSVINLWNSGGTWTEAQAADSIFPRLRVLAQKTWDSALSVPTYAEFSTIVNAVGSAPA